MANTSDGSAIVFTTHKDKAERPIVTYITVSYNSEKLIEKTIKSIAECKALFPCEHIIIDGNSTDGTAKILSKYRHTLDTIIQEPDYGIYNAMNKGLQLAKGEYICYINTDDQVIPKGAQKAADLLEASRRQIDCLASTAIAVKEKKKSIWIPSVPSNYMEFRCPNLCHNGVYTHRSLFEEIGSFDEELQIAGDTDWIIRALRSADIIKFLNVPTVLYSLGGISSNFKLHSEEMVRIASKYYPQLRPIVIKSLFYHLFSWRNRRVYFTEGRALCLKESTKEANSYYPQLPYLTGLFKEDIRQIAQRISGKIGHAFRFKSS